MTPAQLEQRPTPETDALSLSVGKNALHPTTVVVALNDARKLERERDEAREQIQMMLKHDASRLESDSIVGSCDCLTKTPEMRHHKPGCKYRLISERDEAREELKREQQALRNAATDCFRYIDKNNKLDEELREVRRELVEKDKQLEAMREAIKEAHAMFQNIRSRLQSCGDGRHESLSITTTALAKLQPFLP